MNNQPHLVKTAPEKIYNTRTAPQTPSNPGKPTTEAAKSRAV
jgi:hypothetical protein